MSFKIVCYVTSSPVVPSIINSLRFSLKSLPVWLTQGTNSIAIGSAAYGNQGEQ
jgi:hypothetical protein